MPYLDPRLSRHLQDTNPTIPIDAIFILVSPDENPSETEDNRFAERLLQQIIEQTNEHPSLIRWIPRANAVALTASPKLIKVLLDHPGVQIASSATIDPFHF